MSAAIATLLLAAAPLASYDWSTLELPAGAERVAHGAASLGALRVQGGAGAPSGFTLLEIDSPPVGETWHLRGTVRYSGVAGDGYLELLTFFPGHSGPYFSRSVEASGPLRKLSGDSDWRPFALPFDARGAAAAPERLVLRIVLPGPGSVEVGPVELHGGLGGASAGGTGWWGERTAGLAFGAAGGVLGLLGAVIGTLAAAGRARGLVIALWYVVTIAALGSLGTGLLAAAAGQPYAVYYPLLLTGGIALVIFLALRRSIWQRYQSTELRRMRALDSRA